MNFDIVVIGAGHAGIEAALAAAKTGIKTAIFTINKSKAGEMSCNPAIGGLAKGQVVREIDALGGIMAKAADTTCIQFKVLNSAKGPAVRGLRAQADKIEYCRYMLGILENTPGLTLIDETVLQVTTSDSGVTGVICASGERFGAKSVIITVGTFLNGMIHIGLESFPGGRRGDPPAVELSESLKSLGLKTIRLKTGTPPRVARDSLDYSFFTEQPGDAIPVPFSFSTEKITTKQAMCWLARTTPETNAVIEANLNRSPLYSSTDRRIFGTGPRYCPSIEDKVVKFPDKKSHQVFIEPEWRDSSEMYLNGLSSSLPADVQEAFLKTIPGFKDVKIIRPAYGIEYDSFPSYQIKHTLETREIPGLFLAGQINGTSGYEEAAAQGIVAGINAAAKIKNMEPLILRRAESYIGVMIDDLVTLDLQEPYRLFSSRAEYRLLLRNDNADMRLNRYGEKYGLLSGQAAESSKKKKEFIEAEKKRLEKIWLKPSKTLNDYLSCCGTSAITEPVNLMSLFKRPETSYEELAKYSGGIPEMPQHCLECLEAEVKYEGYITRQLREIEQNARLENKKIPADFDYTKASGLSTEARQYLARIKPETIGSASRIPGVTPADINVLLILLRKTEV